MRIHYAFFCVLVGGCFADPGPGGGDDDDAAMTEGTGSGTTDTASATSVGTASGSGTSVSGTSVDPTTPTTTTDTATTDETSGVETGIPSCGALGEACCGGINCDEGACWHDQCVVFAGAYAEPNTCGGCTTDPSGNMDEIPPSTIPYLGMCGCPEGFRASSPLPTTSDYCPQEALLHTETDVYFCEYEDVYTHATWQGAYATSQDPACETDGIDDGCVRPNLYTDGCSCPDGSVQMVAETWAKCQGKGTADNAVEIHVCMNEGADPSDFGGAYQLRWLNQGGTMCEAGNPLAGGDCACPMGFFGEALRITSPTFDNGGDLFMCVR